MEFTGKEKKQKIIQVIQVEQAAIAGIILFILLQPNCVERHELFAVLCNWNRMSYKADHTNNLK